MHKKRSKCRAQVTGEQPTRRRVGSDAFNWHSPAFFAFSARFSRLRYQAPGGHAGMKNLTVSTEIRIAHH
ncbi:hypothetical protein SY86_23570, partial [Erwinia tracheiphila]